jgi:hypothetical protein
VDPNFYYLAEKYECLENGDCSYVEDVIIMNPTELTINPTSARYRLDPTTGYIFRVLMEEIPQTALITNMSGLGNPRCNAFCAQPTPTPTPTPTPATPTPTPTATPATPTPTPTPTPTVTPLPGSGYYDGGYGCCFYTYDPGFTTCNPSIEPTCYPIQTPTPTPTEDFGGGGAGGRYNCTPSGCVQALDGDYGTLQDCQASCVQGPIP